MVLSKMVKITMKFMWFVVSMSSLMIFRSNQSTKSRRKDLKSCFSDIVCHLHIWFRVLDVIIVLLAFMTPYTKCISCDIHVKAFGASKDNSLNNREIGCIHSNASMRSISLDMYRHSYIPVQKMQMIAEKSAKSILTISKPKMKKSIAHRLQEIKNKFTSK